MSGNTQVHHRNVKLVPLHAQSIIKVHATSSGVFFDNPTEGPNNGALRSVTGGGPAQARQQATVGSWGSVVARDPIGSLRLPPTLFSGNFGASSVIPAPDFTPGLGSGQGSFTQINSIVVDNFDWIGDWANCPDGVMLYLSNLNGNGYGFNVVDGTYGGSVVGRYPSQFCGYYGHVSAHKLASVTHIDEVYTGRNAGPFSLGSRVTTIAAGTTAEAYQQLSTTGSGGVSAFTYADILALDLSGTVLGFWGNARYGWNNSNVQVVGKVATATTGVPAVSDSYVPGAVVLTNDYSGGSTYRFLITNNTGASIVSVVNNWRTSVRPY